ncbi:MAG: LPS export ABC transporter periplasmic protein LptC [Candidatus Omnitrophica bacterium]|nr:LPS export ABC transporter periplasmic protein LptC [Candidatus Omnitrophota bacterium]
MRLKAKACVFIFFLFSSFAFGATTDNPETSDQQIGDFSLSGYEEKGKKGWDLAGKSADIFTDEVKLKDVNGNLYGKDENVNLTAKTGEFNKASGKVHLEKDVVITTSKGARLTTDSMDWDRKNQLVTTKDRVNIAKDNINITATGARGEPNLKKIALNKDVRVDINPPAKPAADAMDLGKEKTTITCEGALEVDYEKNIATFNKDVKVVRPDTIIYSDRMDLYFSAGQDSQKQSKSPQIMGNNKIDKIVARGNVRIVRGENISYSDEAVYNAVDSKIILTGRPKLVFYSSEGLGGLENASFGNSGFK